ncbi:PKD domain-containing protein [Pontibacter pamirensis]|uniref:PKD domain-containing protein n=1 Tax=Pontibacter pamirensis TaxID=2562824 RepID=UPI00138A38B4|nr:hypothetical protein [Pontibacter pamirensis]
MKPHLRLTFILLLAQLPLLSCQEDLDADLQTTVEAKAGPDQSITLPQDNALLDGSQSSATKGNITNYGWSKIAGPLSFHIADASAAQTQVSELTEGEYLFVLKVTAEGGVSATDTMVLVVVDTADDASAHWTLLTDMPQYEPIVDPEPWFNGSNFLLGIANQVFAVSNRGACGGCLGTIAGTKGGIFPRRCSCRPLSLASVTKGTS